MIGEELFLNELNFHIRQGVSKKDLTDLINERLKQLTIPDVMQSCDTCKHLSTCRFWQEAPNNGATCKFYIEHVA